MSAKTDQKPAKSSKNAPNSYSESAKKRIITDFLQAYEDKFNVALACKAAGISRSTLHRWRARNKKLDKQIREITAMHLDSVEQTLVELIRDPKQQSSARVQAAKTILEGRRAKIYNRRPIGAENEGRGVNVTFMFGSEDSPNTRRKLTQTANGASVEFVGLELGVLQPVQPKRLSAPDVIDAPDDSNVDAAPQIDQPDSPN